MILPLLVLILCCIQYGLQYVFITYKEKSTSVTIEELYDVVKHGDVIITSSCIPKPINQGHLWYHSGLSHSLLIIEEDNIKYVVHAHPCVYSYHESCIKKSIYTTFPVARWIMIKEPLQEFLLMNSKSIYHIYQPPHRNLIVSENHYNFSCVLFDSLYYCTIFTSDILVTNKMIPSSSKYIRYRTDEFIQVLQQSGYKMFSLLY